GGLAIQPVYVVCEVALVERSVRDSLEDLRKAEFLVQGGKGDGEAWQGRILGRPQRERIDRVLDPMTQWKGGDRAGRWLWPVLRAPRRCPLSLVRVHSNSHLLSTYFLWRSRVNSI